MADSKLKRANVKYKMAETKSKMSVTTWSRKNGGEIKESNPRGRKPLGQDKISEKFKIKSKVANTTW